MYTSEQIVIPQELGTIMKLFTKAAIREQPKDLYKWSANYFAQQNGQPKPFDDRGQLVSQGNRPTTSGGSGPMVADVISDAAGFESVPTGADPQEKVIEQLFAQYDHNGNGRLERSELPALIADLKESMGVDISDSQIEEMVNMLDTDEDGTIDLDEFRGLFASSADGEQL